MVLGTEALYADMLGIARPAERRVSAGRHPRGALPETATPGAVIPRRKSRRNPEGVWGSGSPCAAPRATRTPHPEGVQGSGLKVEGAHERPVRCRVMRAGRRSASAGARSQSGAGRHLAEVGVRAISSTLPSLLGRTWRSRNEQPSGASTKEDEAARAGAAARRTISRLLASSFSERVSPRGARLRRLHAP